MRYSLVDGSLKEELDRVERQKRSKGPQEAKTTVEVAGFSTVA